VSSRCGYWRHNVVQVTSVAALVDQSAGWSTVVIRWPCDSRVVTDSVVIINYCTRFQHRPPWRHQQPLASTPPGMPGTHPPIFWLGRRQREYPPAILLRTFGYSRPILVALRSLSLKPISFGYKTPPIRFSQAGGQSAHKARPPPTLNSR